MPANLVSVAVTHRLAILVTAAAFLGGWAVWHYLDRELTPVTASYEIIQVSLPPELKWHRDDPYVQILILKLSKASGRKATFDGVEVSGVKEILAVTALQPDAVAAKPPVWSVSEGTPVRIKRLLVRELAPLPAGFTSAKIYAWGEFILEPYVSVSIEVNGARIEAQSQKTVGPNEAFIWNNFGWFLLVILGALAAGALAYIDKKKP